MLDQVDTPLDLQSSDAICRFVAADVGGTHARIAIVHAQDRDAPDLQLFRSYPCAEHLDLGALLQHYFDEIGRDAPGVRIPRSAVIACAGYVIERRLVHANLPWIVDIEALQRRLNLQHLEIVNDFEAVAVAVATLPEQSMHSILSAAPASPGLPVLVLGAGTGFGAALCVQTPSGLQVLPTEAGQAGFAPATEHGLRLLNLWRSRQARVRIEDLLSGPGLLRVYQGLCELEGLPPLFASPAQVSAAADADAIAASAVEVFCSELGNVCSDLALATGAFGGVRLAGGVLPHLIGGIRQAGFRRCFLEKGAMRPQLERVPVHLVEHGDLGVVGAACRHIRSQRECAARVASLASGS